VMTEWIDLRCPFCASFARESLPQLIEEYVDTGQVRIEYTDVAYFGEQSEDASVAAQAAANQDKYIDYITAVFDDAPENGHADLTRDILIDYAEQVDVPDMDAFTADLDDPAIREQAQAETMNAQRLGVSAVPFFVAGDTAMSGAQPVDSFRDYLDDAVAKAERPMDSGRLGAFLGGILTLLSPCSAMLLPAFFSYAFASPRELLTRTGVFYLGLITTLVPLGVLAGTLGAFVNEHRFTFVTIASVVVIALGALI